MVEIGRFRGQPKPTGLSLQCKFPWQSQARIDSILLGYSFGKTILKTVINPLEVTQKCDLPR